MLAEVDRYVLKRRRRDGWYALVGKYQTEADALEAAAQKRGTYHIELLAEDGTAMPDFKPVEVRTVWYPLERELRAFVLYDPNKPVDQAKLDALYAAADSVWEAAS